MKEVYKNVFVGDQNDYEKNSWGEEWNIIQACKEPYHRGALGYKGRGAPKNHPEYLMAKRGNRLILNLIDPENMEYIPKEIIDESIRYIYESIKYGKKVFIHCNQGKSRSGGIAFLYLISKKIISGDSIEEIKEIFKFKYYPIYEPGNGMDNFVEKYWKKYQKLNY